MAHNRSYATFEEWEADLKFGPYVEDKVVQQVRRVARQAWEAGFKAGLFSVTMTVTGSPPQLETLAPIVLQASYQLRRSRHCALAFCYAAKVYNHYGYSWACRHHHGDKSEALECAKGEITRLKGNNAK